MQHPQFNSAPYALAAVMTALCRRGGSLRIGALLRASGLALDELCATVNELSRRRWVKVAWRRVPRATGPERLRPVERVTATRFGRWRAPRPDRPRAGKRAPAFPRER